MLYMLYVLLLVIHHMRGKVGVSSRDTVRMSGPSERHVMSRSEAGLDGTSENILEMFKILRDFPGKNND